MDNRFSICVRVVIYLLFFFRGGWWEGGICSMASQLLGQCKQPHRLCWYLISTLWFHQNSGTSCEGENWCCLVVDHLTFAEGRLADLLWAGIFLQAYNNYFCQQFLYFLVQEYLFQVSLQEILHWSHPPYPPLFYFLLTQQHQTMHMEHVGS